MGEQVGQFEITSVLGGGGMATVYRGEHVSGIGMDAAIKKLHPHLALDKKLRARLKVEAQALSRLKHPNIVQIFDYVDVEGDCALVTELVEGATLRDVLAEYVDEPMPVSLALGLFRQILDGVRHAHRHSCLHRDLKPGNIMITEERLVKLLDFGIASLIDTDRMTKTGVSLGTPVYMAPEQLAGVPDLDARADIYALGVILWEMLAGSSARRGGGQGWRLSLEHVDALIAAGVPGPLVDVVRGLVKQDREERYADCDRVAQELTALLDTDCLDEESRLVLGGLGPSTSAMRLPTVEVEPLLEVGSAEPVTQTVIAPRGLWSLIRASWGRILTTALILLAVAADLSQLLSDDDTEQEPTPVTSATSTSAESPDTLPVQDQAASDEGLSLYLASTPVGAALYLDGEAMGSESITTMVPAVEGELLLKAELPGYSSGKTLCRIDGAVLRQGHLRCIVRLEKRPQARRSAQEAVPSRASPPKSEPTTKAPVQNLDETEKDASKSSDERKIYKIE